MRLRNKIITPHPLVIACNTDSQFRGSSRDGVSMGSAAATIPYILRAAQVLMTRDGWADDVIPLKFVGSKQNAWPLGATHSDVVGGEPASSVVTTFETTSASILQTPDYHFVWYGANDVVAGRTLQNIIDDLNDICDQIDAKWSGATIPVICTGYYWTPSNWNVGGHAAGIDAVCDAIRGGAITSAGDMLDQSDFPVTGYMSTTVEDPDPHAAIPNVPGTLSSWDGTLDPQDYGGVWLAWNLLEFLRPGAVLPLTSGETYP